MLRASCALVLVVAALLAADAALAHAAGYRSLSAGGSHACAIRVDDDAIACWGDDSLGQASPPSGRFAAVFAGVYHGCAIRLLDRSAVCWGYNHAYYERFLPAGPVASIGLGVFFICSLSAEGRPICADKGPSCDICEDGIPLSHTPPGSFEALAAGWGHACAIRDGDDTLACWGDDTFGQASPPPGAFASVSAGYDFTCGVRLDHVLLCWGWDMDGRAPPAGSFTRVAAGASHACALRTDGSVACWGRNASGQTDAPSGSFTEVSGGYSFSCGVRTNGSLACWGANGGGQADPPAELDRTPPVVQCSASPSSRSPSTCRSPTRPPVRPASPCCRSRAASPAQRPTCRAGRSAPPTLPACCAPRRAAVPPGATRCATAPSTKRATPPTAA
jgi:alpha-tubulin suppressor-like RCC1 family protein